MKNVYNFQTDEKYLLELVGEGLDLYDIENFVEKKHKENCAFGEKEHNVHNSFEVDHIIVEVDFRKNVELAITNNITFAFWFYIADEKVKNNALKWRTLIQGRIGIGGIIACSPEFELGCFDELSGQFLSFGINVLNLRKKAENDER